MASDLLSMLTPSIVTKIISQIRTPGNVLSRLFGFEIGGANVHQVPGYTYTYDIYNNVRSVARGRGRGAPSGTTALNPIGNVQLTLARSAEKIQVNYERLLMLRTLGENAGVLDLEGEKYLQRQFKTLVQRQNNFREFIVAGACFNGGQYGFYKSGDDLVPTFDQTGPFITVNHQIPSTNLLLASAFTPGLTMGGSSNIINEPWSSRTSNIPKQLDQISDGMMNLVGEPLQDIFVDNITKGYLLVNDYVRGLAGTANTPFESYENAGIKNPDGSDAGVWVLKLTGMPQYRFHVYSGVLEVASGSGTNLVKTKLLPDGYATFMMKYDSSWLQMVEGSEIIKDNDLAAPVERQGHYAFMMEKADPARLEAHNIQNCGLELNIPSGIATARVR